jgi:hypothetical protein
LRLGEWGWRVKPQGRAHGTICKCNDPGSPTFRYMAAVFPGG